MIESTLIAIRLRVFKLLLSGLKEKQGNTARRNALRAVKKAGRRLLQVVEQMYPAPPRKPSKKRRGKKPSEWAGQKSVNTNTAKKIASAGIKIDITDGNIWVPQWAWVLVSHGENTTTLKKAKRDIGLRRERLAIHALASREE